MRNAWSPACGSYFVSKKTTKGTERGRIVRGKKLFSYQEEYSLETAEAFKTRNRLETMSKERAAFISHNARTSGSPVNLSVNKFRAKKKKCNAWWGCGIHYLSTKGVSSLKKKKTLKSLCLGRYPGGFYTGWVRYSCWDLLTHWGKAGFQTPLLLALFLMHPPLVDERKVGKIRLQPDLGKLFFSSWAWLWLQVLWGMAR